MYTPRGTSDPLSAYFFTGDYSNNRKKNSPTTTPLAIGCPIPELTHAAQRRSRTFVRAHVEKRCLFMWDKTFLTLRLYIYKCYALSLWERVWWASRSFAPNLKLNDQLNYRLWPWVWVNTVSWHMCALSYSLYRIASPLCEATKIFILTHISGDAHFRVLELKHSSHFRHWEPLLQLMHALCWVVPFLINLKLQTE